MRVCILKKGSPFFSFPFQKQTWYQSHSTPRRYLPTFFGEVPKLLTSEKHGEEEQKLVLISIYLATKQDNKSAILG